MLSLRSLAPLVPVCLFLAAPLPARAVAFSNLFAFGDSLSDSGNTTTTLDVGGVPSAGTCAVSALFPQPPYVGGACTNGPTWVEVLAQGLSLTAEPGTAGGTNFAVGGATAATDAIGAYEIFTGGDGNTEDLSDQVGRFLASPLVTDPNALDPNALYVILAGGNDIQFTARGVITPGPGQDVAQDAVDAILATASDLASRGAQHFLFANMYDLGIIPDATLSAGQRAAATQLTQDFNSALAAAVAGFGGGSAAFLDVDALVQAVLANPAAFGIANTSDACVISGTFGQPQNVSTPCGLSAAIQDTYLFFDEIHPNSVIHAALGQAALATLPEPSSLGLAALGLVAAVRAARRRSGR